MPRSAPKPEATNSLVVLFDTYSNEACDELRAKLEACGPLWHFAKLKSFQRCLAVFHETADAHAAMRRLNGTSVLGDNKLRLYFSMHTPLVNRPDNLAVPDQEKLWLISPPGSPPIDWRQTREQPPNSKHLDHRLEAALQELEMGTFTLDPAAVADDDDDNILEHTRESIKSLALDSSAANSSIAAPSFTISQGGIDGDDSSSSDGQLDTPAVRRSVRNMPTILIQHCDSGDQTSTSSTLAERSPTPGPMFKSHKPTSRPP
ncbi:hypothetical protein LPJ78_002359 [Coemansia sp. RSA 989]|nr:Calcipressin-domain-containing protein [Coemansia mojavensis]KAJ1742733.1 hypothetical protein LPJ68_001612 [Coemansia sp. RSA 1086]KAJ1751344.1 hypothetical protein LPJ79_002125 [Coemansia sp. RSA 1821]KAJ1865864.1 hypothetical protein LPJ78_002359 [Coemansia sp. RSA 989]KAJ1873116.1 hypothetical protein LPJ55_002582 [Coemansia sp. RSA 990]KAJ2633343.1 hypothetical protein H4R22_000531 [Coemansia sp. RSA 1290]KAJ2647807.1 hypothetical protein IWW40_004429 [Coemansia sp. RSA 1250]KAJ26698